MFLTTPTEKNYQLLCQYEDKKIGRSGIAGSRFLMCVRPSMQRYLEKLSQEVSFSGGILLYSLWDGYREKQEMADFLQFMEEKGVSIVPLHTSGHAEAAAFDALIKQTQPEYILPVHTENAVWFERYKQSKVVYESVFSF